jgi:hypothetical protein
MSLTQKCVAQANKDGQISPRNHQNAPRHLNNQNDKRVHFDFVAVVIKII